VSVAADILVAAMGRQGLLPRFRETRRDRDDVGMNKSSEAAASTALCRKQKARRDFLAKGSVLTGDVHLERRGSGGGDHAGARARALTIAMLMGYGEAAKMSERRELLIVDF